MPSPLRFAAASLRGLYLRSWRYGVGSERLVEEALDREHWDVIRWKKWQDEQLAFVLNRAATRVPYYRDLWATRRRHGDRRSWGYLENWPILDKEPLRRNPHAFVADDCNINLMFHEHTSGTTGTPVNVWWSRKTVQMFYALFEARWRRWYGVSRRDRWAIIGGQLITPMSQRKPPFWVWNAGLKQLYMSSYHLAPDYIPYYVEALKNYHVKYIFGYSSSLHILALETLRLGIKDLKMTVAITNAEPLFTYQREAISEAFHCPVRETYGMAEIVAAASECEHGRLHLWPEVGSVEIFQNNLPSKDSSPGEFVCTGLLNTNMPLIRYRNGDRGALMPVQAGCECGRFLPALAFVEGRTDDVLYAADGRLVGRLDPVFKDHLLVREAQIIQENLGSVRIRYVPDVGFTPEMARALTERLRARMGMVEVVLDPMDSIPRERNGKFRSVICRLSSEEKIFAGHRTINTKAEAELDRDESEKGDDGTASF